MSHYAHRTAHVLTGRDHHACRARKRRLPWQLSFHDQPQSIPPVIPPACTESDSSVQGSLSSGGLCGGGSSVGIGGSRSCASLSTTTSKKTMESLCSSVYEELQPFRRAHRSLIKVRSCGSALDFRGLRSTTPKIIRTGIEEHAG